MRHVAVVQYTRPVSGYHDASRADHVAHFHLALVAFENDPSKSGEWRMLWQANNAIVPLESRVEWRLDIKENVHVAHTQKFLGGVYIGKIKASELEAMDKAIRETAVRTGEHLLLPPRTDNTPWKCRVWTEEVILQKLIPNGWAHPSIISQADLLPALCQAAQQVARNGNSKAFVKYPGI